MDANQAEVFLALLGCEKIHRRSGWVNGTCPFSRYKHSRGRDDHPSFGISIDPNGSSNYRCQACGVHGALIPMLWKMEDLGIHRYDLLPYLLKYNQFDVEKFADDPKPRGAISARVAQFDGAGYFGLPDKPPQPKPRDEKKQSEVPEAVLDKMRELIPDDVRAYLETERQLSPLTVEEWELGWHPDERRLCIPIRDADGKLVSISGRALMRSGTEWTDKLPDDFKAPKYLHSPFSRNVILYGMHKIVSTKRVGYLFEGFFQAIFSWQCGYDNVLGRMGTHLSGQQKDFLRQWFDKLVLVPDGDPAGYESVEQIQRELEQELNRIPEIVIADMVPGKDADQLDADLLREILGSPND